MAIKKKSTSAGAKSKKSVTKPAARKTAAKKSAAKKSAVGKVPAKAALKNGSALGTYTVPRGHVSIAVPPFWTLRQTNEDLEVDSPSGSTSVIVTVFQRTKEYDPLDAREYLQHFLETAAQDKRVKVNGGTKKRAEAKYKDPEGDSWQVLFVTNGDTLLLGTCSTSLPATNKEPKTGSAVLESLKLK